MIHPRFYKVFPSTFYILNLDKVLRVKLWAMENMVKIIINNNKRKSIKKILYMRLCYVAISTIPSQLY